MDSESQRPDKNLTGQFFFPVKLYFSAVNFLNLSRKSHFTKLCYDDGKADIENDDQGVSYYIKTYYRGSGVG